MTAYGGQAINVKREKVNTVITESINSVTANDCVRRIDVLDYLINLSGGYKYIEAPIDDVVSAILNLPSANIPDKGSDKP